MNKKRALSLVGAILLSLPVSAIDNEDFSLKYQQLELKRPSLEVEPKLNFSGNFNYLETERNRSFSSLSEINFNNQKYSARLTYLASGNLENTPFFAGSFDIKRKYDGFAVQLGSSKTSNSSSLRYGLELTEPKQLPFSLGLTAEHIFREQKQVDSLYGLSFRLSF